MSKWAEHMINDVMPGPRPADALPGESVEDYVRRTGKSPTQSGQGLPRIELGEREGDR